MAEAAQHLEDDFQATVQRARRSLRSIGELPLQSGPTTLPLSEKQRAALIELIRNGTYRRAADEVAASDPDLAN